MSLECDYLQLRKVWKVSPTIQIGIIVFLYLLTVYFGYHEYIETGLLQGFPFRTGILFVPIYEEVIFRGIILSLLIKSFSTQKGIMVSSLLFGLWHVKNVFYLDSAALTYQILYTAFIFGPITAYMTVKTKTIFPAIILHYLNNLIAVYGMVILGMLIS